MHVNQQISIAFSLKWQSPWAAHMDRYFANGIDLRRDIFPQDMARQVSSLEKNEGCEKSFAPGILVDAFEKNRIIPFHESAFEAETEGDRILPRLGRFYPQGFAWTALNCYPRTQKPFRVIQAENGELVADANHRLARYPLTLQAVRVKDLEPNKGYSGEVRDIAEMVAQNGPGMQIRPWQKLHRFERLGLVLDYYLKTGAFEDLHTESVQGFPRPKDDKHISERKVSDPVFAVWGWVRKQSGDQAVIATH